MIEVNEKRLHEVFRRIVRATLIIVVVVGLTVIGYFVTPSDTNGNLLLLSPSVAAIAGYQRHVRQWALELRTTEVQMYALETENTTDLYAQDSALQDINRNVNALSSEIDSTRAPDSLKGLHDLIANAANAHMLASAALEQWLGAPSTATKAAASEAIDTANGILEQVYSNPWVTLAREPPPENANGSR
jgi:hypothetical protein